MSTATFARLQRRCSIEVYHGVSQPKRLSKRGEVAGRAPVMEERLASEMQGRCAMATPVLSVHSAVAEYGVFWQLWPQFEQTPGERRLVGFEVELIGSHASDLNHVDPACPMCRHVRSVLLAIADLIPGELTLSRNSLTYNIDSHSNSIVCLPALGNRSAVWVSIYVFLNPTNGQSFETDPLNEVKTFLNRWGIHQR